MRRIMHSLPAEFTNRMAASSTPYRCSVPSASSVGKKAASTVWTPTATAATAAAESELALKANRAFSPLPMVR